MIPTKIQPKFLKMEKFEIDYISFLKKKLKKDSFFFVPKLDGMALRLVYEDGILVKAFSKKTEFGLEKFSKLLPFSIPNKEKVTLQGELLFQKRQAVVRYGKIFHFFAGSKSSLKEKDFLFQPYEIDDFRLKNLEKFQLLKTWGFKPPKMFFSIPEKDPDDLFLHFSKTVKQNFDGLVFFDEKGRIALKF